MINLKKFTKEALKASVKLNKKLETFCEPLKTHFNINFFYYHAVTDDGNYFLLANKLSYQEYYFDEELFFNNIYMRHSSHFNEGLQYHRYLQNQDFQDLLNYNKKYNISSNFLLMNKIENGFDSYGFGSSCFSHEQDALIMRELPILKLFINQFKEEFKNIIARKNEFQVNIGSVLGNRFHEPIKQLFPQSVDHCSFIKSIQSELSYLSKRELTVLKLLIQGRSGSDISKILLLSTRTIEHYIENIKNKLNCTSKRELCIKYSHFNNFLN